MKKLFSLVAVLSLALVSACNTVAPADESTDLSSMEETSVKQYSDDLLSFDYPGDLFIFRETVGEGSYGETLIFMQWNEEGGVYEHAGPALVVNSFGREALSPAEQYLSDQKYDDGNPIESLREMELASAQAFEWDSEGGICEGFTGLEFLFDQQGTDFYGVFSPAAICPGLRYEEIRTLFKESVEFKAL
ncbi:hypothetical protein IPG41_01565 [Candidatus Peregrinibacteria bacterium]|nr:MAG: hypothetical protein IPG41_01565 [Candidatus Peregrinibacteria bacterium]